MYLQFDDELNILPATVKNVSLPIFKQFVSTLPIMIGIAYFCMSFFGMSWRFNSLDKSIIMLWANWNGDELQNMYHAIFPISIMVGPVFLYAWIWFSNNMIHNAFLAMVEDGYVLQSKKGMFSWLTDELEDPDKNNAIFGESDDEPELSCEQFIKTIKKTELIQSDMLYDPERYKIKKLQIQGILEMEDQKLQARQIKSKRSLHIILKLDEIDWTFSTVQNN